jgi:ligand-binding sensor domain-containing protein
MSSGHIDRFVPPLARYGETEPVKPPAVHPGWENYVSQGCVRALVAAPRSARLWLATWGGVLAWNRKEDSCYLRYASEHGLAGNAVACLALDEAGRVWAGHDEGGLSYFAGGRWHVYEELGHEPIRAVCAAPGGGVWAAAPSAVYHVPDAGGSFTVVAREHDGAVEADALLPDSDGVLLGNAWGLFRLRRGHDPERLEAQTLSSCVGLARDGKGDVWVATPHRVYRLRGSRLEVPVPPPEGDAGGIVRGLAAGKDVVWVWTSSGLARIADNRRLPIPWPEGEGGEASVAVRAIVAAGDDQFLWVGTDQRLAVVWLTGQEASWDTDLLPAHPEDELNNLGRCVAGPAGAGSVCVGTAGGLVTFRPDGTWRLDSAAGDVRGQCGGTAQQQEPGVLYLLAWPGGVGRLPAAGPLQFYSPQPEGLPLAVAPGQDGHLHVLTTRGLWRFAPGPPERLADGPGVMAGCLVQTPDRTWWLGTARGLWRRTAAGHWEPAGEQPGPAQAEVTDLLVTGDTLWAATTDGLWARDASGWCRHLPERPGDEGVIRALAAAADPASLWLACEDRLLRYEPAGRKVLASYTPRNSGLGSTRITALRQGDATLWAIGQGGISRLTLEQAS